MHEHICTEKMKQIQNVINTVCSQDSLKERPACQKSKETNDRMCFGKQIKLELHGSVLNMFYSFQK